MYFKFCLLLLELLYISVGADDVFNLVGVRILKGEAAGSDQHPFPVFGSKTVHHRQDLTFQFHNLLETLSQMALIFRMAEF